MKACSFFSELVVLLEDEFMALQHAVELVNEFSVLSSEAHHLQPELIELLLLAHPGPASRLSVGYHPSLLPRINYT